MYRVSGERSSSVSDQEWLRLVLEELRKNNEKVEQVRRDSIDKLEDVEAKIESRLDKSEGQHKLLMTAQAEMKGELTASQESLRKEHTRMNDLLAEHMRRTEANEQMISMLRDKSESLEEQIQPIALDYQQRVFLENVTEKKSKKIVMWIGGIASALGIIATALKLLQII